MGIISTFDLGFKKKTLSKSIDKYGSDRIILIKKSNFFLFIKVLIPFLFWLSILVLALVVFVKNINVNWFLWSLVLISLMLWIVPAGKVLKYYLDYKMDFIIVNPRCFVRYDQEGFFKRVLKTIELKKVRSISVRKQGIFNSIFNNGTLIILSDGGESEQDEPLRSGEIIFKYLYNPESYSKRINHLLSDIFDKQ